MTLTQTTGITKTHSAIHGEKIIAQFCHSSPSKPRTHLHHVSYIMMNTPVSCHFRTCLLYTYYDVTMSETHHIHKLDAHSGTAITLAEGILENMDRKNKWVKGTLLAPDGTVSGTDACASNEFPIDSIREGEVFGIHTIRYESEVDSISITHDAKNRGGFVLGAILAAEYLSLIHI